MFQRLQIGNQLAFGGSMDRQGFLSFAEQEICSLSCFLPDGLSHKAYFSRYISKVNVLQHEKRLNLDGRAVVDF